MKVQARKGDTFWYYSRLFDVPLPFIAGSNRGHDPERLEPGQTIHIPGFLKRTHYADHDDTFWSIATQRGIALDALVLLNPDLNPHHLHEGDGIKLPVRAAKKVVQPEESYDHTALVNDLKRLKVIYPFIEQRKIGESAEGKPIYEVRVGKGRKKVHVNGAIHANEWITSAVIMTFLNDYLLSLTNRQTIRGLNAAIFYDNVSLSLVPMLNPDGVDLVVHGAPKDAEKRKGLIALNKGRTDFRDWKANIRGVDLNDQFPAKWKEEKEMRESKPGPRDFGGSEPLTEPEAKALAVLTKSEQFDRVLAFHTQGEEIYWGFEGYEPKETETLVKEFSRVSGYKPERYVESFAGYKDWFEQEWRKPGFTVELGKGKNPLPMSQFPEIYQKSLGIFLASLYM